MLHVLLVGIGGLFVGLESRGNHDIVDVEAIRHLDLGVHVEADVQGNSSSR